MAVYLVQASYAAQTTAAMVKNPSDRSAVMRPLLERMGGKLIGMWFAFGSHDVVAIAEMPDNVSAAATALALGASGALSAYQTTPLLTMAEGMEAMKKAGSIGYQPPK